MSYFTDIDAWLAALLLGDEEEGENQEEWFARIKTQLKDKLLESYRNGQKAGPQVEKKPFHPRARFPRKYDPRQ